MHAASPFPSSLAIRHKTPIFTDRSSPSSHGNCSATHTPKALQAQKPADTASDWKEFTSPDGRKYYHNRKTKESKWTMPEDMKRAQAAAAAAGAGSGSAGQAQKAAASAPQLVKVPVAHSTSPGRASSTPAQKSPLVMTSSTLTTHLEQLLRSRLYRGSTLP